MPDSVISRILSGLSGALILCISAVFTLGTSLAAPIGVLLASRLLRGRGRTLTRGGSWLAAVATCSVAIACVFAVGAALAPPGTFRQFHEAMAATPTATAPQPPAWLTRVMPQAARPPDPMTERIIRSRAFTLYFAVMGAGIAIAILGTVVGSAGWLGTILLKRAFWRRLQASA